MNELEQLKAERDRLLKKLIVSEHDESGLRAEVGELKAEHDTLKANEARLRGVLDSVLTRLLDFEDVEYHEDGTWRWASSGNPIINLSTPAPAVVEKGKVKPFVELVQALSSTIQDSSGKQATHCWIGTERLNQLVNNALTLTKELSL